MMHPEVGWGYERAPYENLPHMVNQMALRSLLNRVAVLLLLMGLAVLSTAGASRAQDRAQKILDAVVELNAVIPPDARTARGLGTFRRGNGIIIDDSGLVLTIGYLVLEATRISLVRADGRTVPAEYVAYDYNTGFGLVRAIGSLGAGAIPFGDSSTVSEADRMLVVGSGGRQATIGALVVSRRPFAGYWEYMLENAIFTAPLHDNWGGAALVNSAGELMGVGSLRVGDAQEQNSPLTGNMFVPINLLKPILADMLAIGRGSGPNRPYLGVFSRQLFNLVVITGVAQDGPAARAGIKRGDVVFSIGGQRITKHTEFYRTLWSQGEAGDEVRVEVLRGGSLLEFRFKSGDRDDFYKTPRGDSF